MKTAIINANVYLEREKFAQAVLISDETIEKVGTNAEILADLPKDGTTIDAQGKTLIPGFNDSHEHLFHVGDEISQVHLLGVTSLAEVIERGRKFIAEKNLADGEVVCGNGWNQDYFTDEKRLLNRYDLDKISTEHPIIFNRACGHVLVCNTLALKIAGLLDGPLPNADGGAFNTDENGELTGVISENARVHVQKIVPPLTKEQIQDRILAAMKYANANGITTVQTNDVRDAGYEKMLFAYKELFENKSATLRIYHQCRFPKLELLQSFIDAGYTTGTDDEYMRIGPLKLFVDGSLGARTALMRQDYNDAPGVRGISTLPQEELNALVQLADKNGMSVAIHAIGDRAIEMVLDSYATVIKNGKNPRRHAIVHCQITDKALLQRFADMNIVALVQPIFLHYDMHICADRVGITMAETSYAFHTMQKLGLHVAFGTDSPVEDLSPINNIHCAVNRQDLKGFPENGYFPNECVDIYDAIDCYTFESAYAQYEENKKGRIKPGFLADLTLLNQDIFHCEPKDIIKTKISRTILAGKTVYQG